MLVASGLDAHSANESLTRAGVSPEPAASDEARTAALALATLSPIELEGLRRLLEDLATRLEARSNPMVEDLDDDDPTAALTRLMRGFLPTLTACDALGSRRRAAADGTLVLAVAMQCDPGLPDAGVDCVPLWKPVALDRKVQRARFLEWPLAAAAVLGFASASQAHEAAGALRGLARDTGSRVALVLEESDLEGRDEPRLAGLRDPAKRALDVLKRNGKVDVRVLELIARQPGPGERRVPWLRLDPEEVLIVPRLGALTDLDAFVREVAARIASIGAGTDLQWVRRPEPIR